MDGLPEYFTTMKEKAIICAGSDRTPISKDALLALCTYVRLPDVDHDLEEVRGWCQEQFGNNWIWTFKDFYFKNPEDATVFKLKWC